MNKIYLCALLVVLAASNAEHDAGMRRLLSLRQRANESPNKIIKFTREDFYEFAMNYPRPYDLVIYFAAETSILSGELMPEYEYLVELYDKFGAISTNYNPTFFVKLVYGRDMNTIFEMFSFNTAPNLVVSKPQMAVVPETERRKYLQKFKWSISYTDGHVTTHKMLEFVNKRTDKDVVYKPTFSTMLKTFFGFIAVAALGAFVYIKLRFLWTNWVVWFAMSILIYIVCCSGVVYDIIHNVPFVGRDQKTGETLIFSDGNREQFGAEGLIISITLTLIGMLFILIVVSGEKVKGRYSVIAGIASLAAIYWLVMQLEGVYRAKSWYGPSFFPPGEYKSGPLSRDQGNNI